MRGSSDCMIHILVSVRVSVGWDDGRIRTYVRSVFIMRMKLRMRMRIRMN